MEPAVALYCRVSTEEQAEHGFSIENQKERLIAYCDSQGWEHYRIYVDDGYTGTNMERPALQRLLHHVRAGEVSTVLVYKLDRLSRKQRDVLHLLEEEFEKNNVAFKSSTEPFDTSSPLGKAMLGILAVFAQLERDTIVERLGTGLRQRVRSGKWPGGRAPFGYTYNQETGKLDINPQQADLIRQLFRRYVCGATLNELANWMASQTPERVFDHAVVRALLTRRVYIGESAHGTAYSTDIAKPIVDRITFELTQAELKKRKGGKSPSGEYLLTGLLYCGLCDAPFIHVTRRNSRGHQRTYQLYGCKNQHHRPKGIHHKRCTVGYRNQSELESWVIQQLQNVYLEPAEIERQISCESASVDTDFKTRKSLQSELKKVRSKLEKWYEAFEEGIVDKGRFQERIAKLEQQVNSLQERLDSFETKEVYSDASEANGNRLPDAVSLIRDAWDYMNFTEQRDVVRAAIDKIIVPPKGEEPKIVWSKA